MLCISSSVALAQFDLYFLSSQITHSNILLLLYETHNALHLHVFFSFFSFFFLFYPKHRQIQSKKIFYRPSNSECNSIIYSYKGEIFRVSFFENKSQRRGIPQELLDKYSHPVFS